VGKARAFPQDVCMIEGDPTKPGSWQGAVEGHEVIINLAGASIFRRWTSKAKQMIRESRILTTHYLVDGMKARGAGKPAFFSASAVGYYGFHGDEELREASAPWRDFLAQVAKDWEDEAMKAQSVASRVVITRFGIVLGRDGGAMARLLPVFRAFLGGPLGDGRQWMSWIHVEDLVEAFLFLLHKPEVAGPVNFTSPYPVRNRDFSISLGRALHRPCIMPIPGFAVRLLMGELGITLLKGQRVLPGVLMDAGFDFRYPTVEMAFKEIVSSA
jgi:uncharacterized protein (TIGR01777 family)